MNLDQAQAWVAQNKVVVLGAAGVGAIALGLRSRSAKNAGDTGGGAGGGGVAYDTAGMATAFSSAPAIAGTAPYNSSASDAYNALEPLISKLYEQQEAANKPIPVPEQPKFGNGYYRVTGSPTIYHVDDQGNRDWLSWTEANALGFSKDNNGNTQGLSLNLASKDDVRWKGTKLVGTDGTPHWDTKIV